MSHPITAHHNYFPAAGWSVRTSQCRPSPLCPLGPTVSAAAFFFDQSRAMYETMSQYETNRTNTKPWINFININSINSLGLKGLKFYDLEKRWNTSHFSGFDIDYRGQRCHLARLGESSGNSLRTKMHKQKWHKNDISFSFFSICQNTNSSFFVFSVFLLELYYIPDNIFWCKFQWNNF